MLKFQPRTTSHLPVRAADASQSSHNITPLPANDLSRYEQNRQEPDDFRHRMLANLAAFAFTAALTGIGIWLAMSISELRQNQDCMLMGRRDCAHIATPQR